MMGIKWRRDGNFRYIEQNGVFVPGEFGWSGSSEPWNHLHSKPSTRSSSSFHLYWSDSGHCLKILLLMLYWVVALIVPVLGAVNASSD